MIRRCGLVLCLMLLVVPVASAQTVGATTGSTNGRVTDETGAVLPGVTVTATSPAMQGQQAVVTNEDGSYRIPAVPPGTYRIVFELAGFTTVVREGIVIGLGFTATVNVQLRVAQLQETVTVTGESPVIDVTSTKTATSFDAMKLASMPTTRDFWSILANAPAVQMQRIDIGGSKAGTQTPYSVYDTKFVQNRPEVEGMVMTEGSGFAMFYYDFGAMDEVSVGTGTHTADMGWPGVRSQFVVKSGGNELHGKIYADYQGEQIQAHNIDARQIALGVRGGGAVRDNELNRMYRYYDINADLGGYIAKDKLWFYGSARDQDPQIRLPKFPVKPHETRLTAFTGKLTYSPSQNNRLIAFTMWGRKNQPNRLDRHLIPAQVAFHAKEDSTWNQLYWGKVVKGEWSRVLSDQAFFEVRGGFVGYQWPNFRYGDAPAYDDIGTNEAFGGNREWALDQGRYQVLGSLSYVKPGWAGEHNFKIGGEVFQYYADARRGEFVKGRPYLPGEVLHVLRNGEPVEVILFGTPSKSENGLWSYAAYVVDTWRLNNHLTLTLGGRFDRYRSYLPEQEHTVGRFTPVATKFPVVDNVKTFNNFAPRVGLTYDPAGDGKTVLKLNYALYWWYPATTIAETLNPNPPDWFTRYEWTDRNGNRLYDPGEEGRITGSRGAGTTTALDPNLENTFTREMAAWVERELVANFGVRTGFVYREIDQWYQANDRNRPFNAFNVPAQVQDPGPDGRVGTADDGRAIQAFNLDPAFVGRPSSVFIENVPGKSQFYTWELVGTKRLANRWSLLAGFAYRWNRDFENFYYGNLVRNDDYPQNPNELVNTDEGRHKFNIWNLKVSGTWLAPWGLVVSPNLRHQSGQPFGRTFIARLNYGTQRILAEPMKARRMDDIWVFDIRVEKLFRLGGAKTLAPFLDLYNINNTNAGEIISWVSGATFLRPSEIISPRIVKFGVKVDW